MAQYETYPKYKYSENSWVGSVPEHWATTRADFVVDTNRQQVSADSLNGIELIHYSIPNVQEYGTGVLESGDKVDSAKLLIKEEQLLVSKLNPRKSTLCIAKPDDTNKVIASSEFVPILPVNADLRYAFYLWSSDKVTKLLSSMVQSVTRSHQRVNPTDILKLHWAWPTSQEQQTIARFLDFKTAQIDALIAKKKALLDKLAEKRTALISHAVTKGLDPSVPMKDSGVEWLGEIPAHWDAKRLKFLGKTRYGLGEPPQKMEGGLPFIRATDIYRGEIDGAKVQTVDPDCVPWSRNPALKAKDILVVRSGAYTGDSAIVPTEWAESIAGYDMVYTTESALPEYIAFNLLSKHVLNGQIYLAKNRAAQPHLNAEELGNVVIALPSLEEQMEIVAHIEKNLDKLAVQFELVNGVIDRLQEYRSALITNTVTGKIDVRGFDATHATPRKENAHA